jgi:hypothetical protein
MMKSPSVRHSIVAWPMTTAARTARTCTRPSPAVRNTCGPHSVSSKQRGSRLMRSASTSTPAAMPESRPQLSIGSYRCFIPESRTIPVAPADLGTKRLSRKEPRSVYRQPSVSSFEHVAPTREAGIHFAESPALTILEKRATMNAYGAQSVN